MSLTVIKPLRLKSWSTTSSFSMRCFCRMRSASSSVVPTGTVTRLSLVIIELKLRMIFLEAQVPVGQDARQPRAAGHRQAGNAVLGHDFERLAQGDVRRNRHRR